MWVMTTQGFYSAVADRDDPGSVIVRARTRDDIEALRKQIPAWLRDGAGWVHLALTLAIVLGDFFVEVYLIGAYIFGAGQGAWTPTAPWASRCMGSRCRSWWRRWSPICPAATSGCRCCWGSSERCRPALANAHAWTGGLHLLFRSSRFHAGRHARQRSLRAHRR